MKHHVDAPDSAVAQSRLLALLRFSQSSVLLEVLVHLLDLSTGELVQFVITDSRDHMLFDPQTIAVRCGGADVGLGIEFIPQP